LERKASLEVFVAFNKVLLQFLHLLELRLLELVLLLNNCEKTLPPNNIVTGLIALHRNCLLPSSDRFAIFFIQFIADGPTDVCARGLVFVQGAQQTKPLSIRQSLADALAAQDLLAVHLVAFEDFLEGVLLRRVAGLPIVNLLWLLNRVVATHLDYF
jgi:hypothetical protein